MKWYNRNNKQSGNSWLKLGSKFAKFLPAGLGRFVGQEVEMSGKTIYKILPDGSLKRLDKNR